VTLNPTADWVARQIAQAFPWDEAPKYLIRDRDSVYGAVVTRRLRAMGIRDRPIAAASPWQNGYAERLIGSIRRECLDHVIVLGDGHLRRVLRAYVDYYNRTRTNWSLSKDAPLSRPIQCTGQIASQAILGGLHHQYGRKLGFQYRHLTDLASEPPVSRHRFAHRIAVEFPISNCLAAARAAAPPSPTWITRTRRSFE
jgi:hypothetical protein